MLLLFFNFKTILIKQQINIKYNFSNLLFYLCQNLETQCPLLQISVSFSLSDLCHLLPTKTFSNHRGDIRPVNLAKCWQNYRANPRVVYKMVVCKNTPGAEASAQQATGLEDANLNFMINQTCKKVEQMYFYTNKQFHHVT